MFCSDLSFHSLLLFHTGYQANELWSPFPSRLSSFCSFVFFRFPYFIPMDNPDFTLLPSQGIAIEWLVLTGQIHVKVLWIPGSNDAITCTPKDVVQQYTEFILPYTLPPTCEFARIKSRSIMVGNNIKHEIAITYGLTMHPNVEAINSTWYILSSHPHPPPAPLYNTEGKK